MELRLKDYGIIRITNATLVEGGDILIEAEDDFEVIARTTACQITEVYLVEVDFEWGLVAWLDLPEYDWYSSRTIVAEIENQDDVYRLNALL